jgi:hypothetical protein
MTVLNRASLDYHYAFDVCAEQAYAHDAFPLCIRAPHGFYLYELLRRITGYVSAVHSFEQFTPARWNYLEQSTASPAPVAETSQAEVLRATRLLVWAEPTLDECNRLLPDLAKQLPANAQLQMIVSRPLARRLPEGRDGILGQGTAPLPVVIQALQQNGFTVESERSFHGPISLIWWQLSVWLERFGQQALADRCWFAMRSTFVASGWQSRFATLTVLVAHPSRQ